jgi:hypothetical protein
MAILAVGKIRQALNIMHAGSQGKRVGKSGHRRQADVQSKKVRQGWHARWATVAVKKGKAVSQVAKQDKESSRVMSAGRRDG